MIGEKDKERRDEGTDPVLNLIDLQVHHRVGQLKLSLRMMISPPLGTAPGALPLTPLRVQAQIFSTFLSILTGATIAPQAEFRLETRPNSSESSVEIFCAGMKEYAGHERDVATKESWDRGRCGEAVLVTG